VCVICVKPSGIDFDYSELRNCWDSNSDGAGIGILRPSETLPVLVKGFMHWKQLENYLKKNIEVNDLVMVHFRYGTSGERSGSTTHPFPISSNIWDLRELSGKFDYLISHNGIVGQGRGKFSDTQLFLWNLSRDIALLPEKKKSNFKLVEKIVIKRLEKECGQRFAFMTSSHIHMIGNFWEESCKSGNYYCNDSYKRSNVFYSYFPEYEDIICPECSENVQIDWFREKGEIFYTCLECNCVFDEKTVILEGIKKDFDF
jgi:hypothetical protein